VLEAAQRQLNQTLKDLPFTLLYLFDESGKAVLAAQSGFDGNHTHGAARDRSCERCCALAGA
jgi:hypothetical protein